MGLLKIEDMITALMGDALAKRVSLMRCNDINEGAREAVMRSVQAEEEACIILKEVEKLYEATTKENTGEDPV